MNIISSKLMMFFFFKLRITYFYVEEPFGNSQAVAGSEM